MSEVRSEYRRLRIDLGGFFAREGGGGRNEIVKPPLSELLNPLEP